jgi:hypothetical protein
MVNMSWLELIILGIIPYGQVIARVKYLNGSIDRPWLFLLAFPPITWYALWQIKKDNVAMGNGTQVYDWFMLIPIVAKVVLPFILSKIPLFDDEDGNFDSDSYLYKIISVGGLIGAVMIPYLIRAYRNCKKITPALFIRSCMNGLITSTAPDILLFILGWVPIFGTILEMILMMPFIGGIIQHVIWTVFFCGTYVITNMFNQGTPEIMCNPGLTGSIADKIFFIIAGGYTVVSNIL